MLDAPQVASSGLSVNSRRRQPLTGWIAPCRTPLDAPNVHPSPSFETRLQARPFFVDEARRAGLSWDALQTERWTRMSRGQYASSLLTRDVQLTLRAVALRMPPGYAFSGPTAAWLLGLDMTPCDPIEVTIDRQVPTRGRVGVRLRRAALPETEVVSIAGFRATSALRTVRDLGSGRDHVESVVAIEIAARAGAVELQDVARYAATHPGEKGIKRLRRATAAAEPRSESPMETRLRLELLKARLPPPCVQADLHDTAGRFLGRADLYYPDRWLVIEYDGENHRDRLVSDMRRQNALVNAGYHVLRFTAADLRITGSSAAQVRQARKRIAKMAG